MSFNPFTADVALNGANFPSDVARLIEVQYGVESHPSEHHIKARKRKREVCIKK
jgi:hypothetical protein